jgi:Arc/MetJ-type ribon-helix-helix transcriptional regulator
MPSPEKRTFSLPVEQAGYIDTLVASGAYDAMQASPGRAVSADEVFAAVRARHADRVRQKPRGASV